MPYNESSPSTGWEETYDAMHVPLDSEPAAKDCVAEEADVSEYMAEYRLKQTPVVRAPTGYDRSMDDLRFDSRNSRLSF